MSQQTPASEGPCAEGSRSSREFACDYVREPIRPARLWATPPNRRFLQQGRFRGDKQPSDRTSRRFPSIPFLFDPSPGLGLAENQHAARDTQCVRFLDFEFGTIGLAVLRIVDPALGPLAVTCVGEFPPSIQGRG